MKGNTFAVKDAALYRASALRASQSITTLDGVVITSAHRAEAEEYLNAIDYMNQQQQPNAAAPAAPGSPQTVKVGLLVHGHHIDKKCQVTNIFNASQLQVCK